ncbi:unnamed protein product [Phytophthora fragariaefolia]|uniref:Unnamed protein product n=1 Tax=Phytophthora fragariaefolia TaxID=1490495 RepID=A0A9W6UCC8_9STRA|nr:unnamed protein product [Phytophthora fragariaefolia]
MAQAAPSAWVDRWLVEDYGDAAALAADGVDLLLLVPVVVGAIVGVALLLLRKRRRRRARDDELREPPATAAVAAMSATTATDSTAQSVHYEDAAPNATLKTLLSSEFLVGKRIPYDQVRLDRVISKGAYGEVWLGDVLGQRVAVKRLLQNKQQLADDVHEFAQEIELSASLGHPNVAGVVGVAWNSLKNLAMVMEFFPVGDLQTYLRKNIDLLSWKNDKIHVAVGLARALEYLHSRTPPLIHRDVKSKNVLLTKSLEAKLIDFGVSRRRQENAMTAGVGTPFWTAPEILEGKRYTEQADIYSFGVVLSELDTGMVPYHDMLNSEGKKKKPLQILAEVVAGTLRPALSEGCPEHIRRIYEACCQQGPDHRPTAAQVADILEKSSINVGTHSREVVL